MTTIIFFNYSDWMDADLKALGQKLNQLFGFCTSLKNENQALRLTLSQSKQEYIQLQTNMQLASTKIEALMQTLPAENPLLEPK